MNAHQQIQRESFVDRSAFIAGLQNNCLFVTQMCIEESSFVFDFKEEKLIAILYPFNITEAAKIKIAKTIAESVFPICS